MINATAHPPQRWLLSFQPSQMMINDRYDRCVMIIENIVGSSFLRPMMYALMRYELKE